MGLQFCINCLTIELSFLYYFLILFYFKFYSLIKGMMDFEERVRELNKYVPILEGFIEKLSGDQSKASHVQSIKNVKSLITERL